MRSISNKTSEPKKVQSVKYLHISYLHQPIQLIANVWLILLVGVVQLKAQNQAPKISFYDSKSMKVPGTNIPLVDFSLGTPNQTAPIIKNSGGPLPENIFGNVLLTSPGEKVNVQTKYGIVARGRVFDGKINRVRSVLQASTVNNPLLATTSRISLIECGKNGVVYFVDSMYYVRKVENGMVTTIKKCPNEITAMKIDSKGNIIIADKVPGTTTTSKATYNVDIFSIKKIDRNGNISLVAGSGKYRTIDSIYSYTLPPNDAYKAHVARTDLYDGKGAAASFGLIYGIALDGNDNIYVNDYYRFYGFNIDDTKESMTQLFRKITPDGVVKSFAGTLLQHPYGWKKDVSKSFFTYNSLVGSASLFQCDAAGNIYILLTYTSANRGVNPNVLELIKLSNKNIVDTIFSTTAERPFYIDNFMLDREGNFHLMFMTKKEDVIIDNTGQLIDTVSLITSTSIFPQTGPSAYDASQRKYYLTSNGEYLLEHHRDGVEIKNFVETGLNYTGKSIIVGTPAALRKSPVISTIYARNKFGEDTLQVAFTVSSNPALKMGKSKQGFNSSLNVLATANAKDSVVIERGFLYALQSANTAMMPDSPGVFKKVATGTKTGNYSTIIFGLTPETNYDLRAYAINSSGIGFSDVKTMSTNLPPVITFIKNIDINIANFTKKIVATVFDFAKGAVKKIDQLSFKIVGNIFKPASKFKIKLFSDPVTLYEGTVGADGIIDVIASIPDTTEPGLHHIVLEAIDSTGKTITKETRINIAEDGTVTEVTNTVFLANLENKLIIDTIQASDADAGQTLTYSIIGGIDSNKVIIDSTTGVLQFKNIPDYEKPGDVNSENVYEVLVQVKDNGVGSEPATVLLYITVTDEKEAPALNNCNVEQVGLSVGMVSGVTDYNGGSPIIDIGFVYSKKSENANPLIGGTAVIKIVSTDTAKVFKGTLQGLTGSTEYVVKAYATNSVGTSYTEVKSFATLDNTSGPFIAYTPDLSYYLKNTITPLTPIQGGTAVPATMYNIVSTFAGALGNATTNGTTNASGTAARFNGPMGMARDTAGNVYLADRDNHLIRKITPAGVVTTLAGTAGSSGSTNGTGTTAKFNLPEDLVIDPSNTYLYVADRGNHKIRKIDITTGIVTNLSGTGSAGNTDQYISPELAQFNNPSGITKDTSGNLYVSDYGNNKIRKISIEPALGNNALNFDGNNYLEVGGSNDLNFTNAITVEAWFKVDAFDKSWQTIAAKGDDSWRLSRSQNGNTMEFYISRDGGDVGVTGVTNVNDGKWHHVAAVYSSSFLELYVDGVLDAQTTVSAGTIKRSSYKVAIGHNNQRTDRKWKGNIDELRIWSIARTISQIRDNLNKSLQGTEDSLRLYIKFDQGIAGETNTGITTAVNSATTGSSLNGVLTGFGLTGANANWTHGYAAISVNTFAGTGTAGATDGNAKTTATFKQPKNIIISKSGILYVAEVGNHKIRKIENGVVSTLAGSTQGYADGQGISAKFNTPNGMDLDDIGNLYVADQLNHRIRKISAQGTVTTLIGTGIAGATDGEEYDASFNKPAAVLVDSKNSTLFIADYEHDKIRKVSLGGYEISHPLPKGLIFDSTTGIISGTPLTKTYKTYYSNSFNDTSLKQAVLYGNTAWQNRYIALTTAVNKKSGAFQVPASGNNEKRYKVNFTLVTSKTSGGADGLSYSFANDASIDATSPAAQVGTGTKFSLSFDDYENTGGERGIRLLYGIKANLPGKVAGQNGVIAYSNNTSWIGKRSDVMLSIDETGAVTVTVDTFIIFNKVRLPASYNSENKATWKHIFRAATGGSNDIHGIDNLVIEEGEGTANYAITAYNYYGSYTTNVPLTIVNKSLPNISYGVTTKTYLRKATITPITITNTGGSVKTSAGMYGQIAPFVGSGTAGNTNGVGINAQLNYPKGIVYDRVNKVFYIADTRNHSIRKVALDGTVSSFAGTGVSGFADGAGATAKLADPEGIAVDGLGNVFVADFNNSLIRKITPAGIVSSFAGGLGITGATNGQGTAARFNGPIGLAIDGSNNVFVTETGNFDVRKITATGLVSTFAGGTRGYVNGIGAAAQFGTLFGASIDAFDNLYVVDNDANVIRKVAYDATVTTYAGSTNGYLDGPAATAQMGALFGTATDELGNVYVAEFGRSRVRKISSTGMVSTLASGFSAASMLTVVDDSSYLYVAEADRHKISRVNLQGYTVTPALPEGLTLDSVGTISGTAITVTPKATYSIIAFNEIGSDTTTIELEVLPDLPKISYTTPHTFVKNTAITTLSPTNTGGTIQSGIAGMVSTFAGGVRGNLDGVSTAAKFSSPYGLAIDKLNNIYVTDGNNYSIRKITPAGLVSTLAGGTSGYADGTGAAAKFASLTGIAVDDSGYVYVTDQGNSKIRKISPAGVVTTIAGSAFGYLDGIGTAAKFKNPSGICVDKSGNMYVADNGNALIRKITPAGVVSTYAGSTIGSDDGEALKAKFAIPYSITIDATGNLFVTDIGNGGRLRKITTDGMVSTLAGSANTGYKDGQGSNAKFYLPVGMTIDPSGNIYVADAYSHKIRKVTSDGLVSTFAGGNWGSTNGAALKAAQFNNPFGIARDELGNLYVSDFGNNAIRKITNTGYQISPALPTGLSMDSAGNIVGTPTAASPKTTYMVLGTNEDGTDTAYIDLAVNETAAAAVPTVTTATVNSITTASATSGGDVTADGGAAITDRGIVWSTSATPTIAVTTKISNGSTTGVFTGNLSGLQPNTMYYVRAYATNSAGTAYGNELSFTTATLPQQGATQLTIAAPSGTMTKEYDGTTSATVTVGALTGVASGDAVTVNSTSVYESSAVGTNKKIIVSYTLSGTGASKYTPPVNDTITTGVITPKQLTIEVPDVSTTKAYDGTTNVNAAAKALKGVIGSDVVSASIAATYDNKNAGTNKTIAVVYTLDGANAANYIKPVDTVITVGEITQALLTVKVKADAKFAGENDVPAYKGVVITGYVNGENATAINQSGLNITRSNSGNNTSGDYTGVLVATGLAADNYSFSYTDGDYSIVPADQLLVRLKDTTVSYGSSPVYVLESAKYFKTGASLVDLTSTTTVAGDTIVAHDGAVATQFNIALVNNSGIRPTVGTYRLDTANVSLSVNVTSVKLLGNYTVTAKGLTVNSSGGASKVYDGSMSMNGVQLQLNGLIAGDKVQVSGNGAFDSKQAGGNKPYTVSSLQLLGMDADNYYLSGSNSISGNDGTILKKQLSISAPTVTASKLVDGTDTASVIAGSLMGVEAGEVVNVITTAKYSDAVIGNNKVIKVSYQLSGADTINYIKPVDDSVTNGIILDTLLTITVPTVTMSKQYDGNTTAAVTIGTINGVKTGDVVTVSGVANYDTKNVDTNKTIIVVYTITGANANKYVAPKNDTISTGAITAKQLSVTAPMVTLSKVYDGTTAATVSVGTLSGLIDGESVLIDAIAVYDDKNVGTGKTIYVNYTLDGATINNYVRPTNYSTTTGAITAAPLTVKVNDDAKFVGETDATTYKGVSISGYVNGETITEIDTTLLVVSRNNVGVENAGDYDTVLSATGLAANNYSFNYVQGKYSIIPADHLLVNLATAKTIYGDSVTYVVESAKYFKSAGNVLVDLTSTTSIKGDGVEVKDGATKTTFAITIPSGSYSSANQLKVGSYVLDTAAVVLSANVVSAKVIGVREVSAKTLTVKTTDGVSKAYDGTKSMASLQLGFDSLLTNDKVTVSGLGYFDTRHTGINKTYELSNMQLGGADALNYCLLGGNNSISGNNGIISVKQLIIANPFIQTSKIYDTNTTATILAIGSLLNAADGDDIAVSAMANYSNAAVGKNKTITVKYTITGADTGNYIKPVDNIDTTGEIISAASFTVSADSLNSFVACTNDTTVAQRFTITGVGLTASLTVSAPIGFELKDSLGNSYDSTLAIVPDTAGNIITTVYVRMKAQAISPANGNIIISTTGLADDSIAVRGVVNALPTVVAISGTATACVGSTTALTNVTTGGIWSSNTTGIATVNASGVVTSVNVGNATITYTVTNANGCVSAVTKTITINALPIVTASINNGKAEKGSNVVLSATGVGSFAWTPATNLLNPDKATTVARVLDNTTYTVTLTNASGCSSTASVLVEATDNMNFEAAYVFTPNGDGINDKFVIKNIEAYPDNKLMVYDRLGKPIYEASGYANNWDGKVNGFTLAKDTYFYVLSVKGQVVKRGAITLVR